MVSSCCSSVSALDDYFTLCQSSAYITTMMSTFGKKYQHYILIYTNVNITLLRRTCHWYSRQIHDVYHLSLANWEKVSIQTKTSSHCRNEYDDVIENLPQETAFFTEMNIGG